MRKLFVVLAGAVVMAASAVRGAEAMPPFAQAYSANCSLCHVQVPALNAYGRYIQRTGYAALDPHVLKRSVPIWFSYNTYYDSQDPTYPHQTQFGNVAVHAIGPIDRNANWTFHFQQWILQNNVAGDLDTFWIAYNNLFDRNGHLFFGKIETPAPSPFSQWFDLANFAPPEIVVGEHPYQLDNNRWGSRFSYVHSSLDAEIGWLGSAGGWSGISDFGSDTDKTLQWKLADADPTRPIEFGLYGSRGSYPLTEGGTDLYHSTAAYVERDPSQGVPGALVIYQIAFDENPGVRLGPAASNAATFEVYQPFFNTALLSIRKEYTNDGLGNRIQSGNIDLDYHVARFLHFYTEAAFLQNKKPSWRYMLWLTLPVSHVR